MPDNLSDYAKEMEEKLNQATAVVLHYNPRVDLKESPGAHVSGIYERLSRLGHIKKDKTNYYEGAREFPTAAEEKNMGGEGI